ncbi:unnamed protein product [Linum tenue]|uniref:F-box domain-containing protein n=2 Tax=Linum tenue TaxID=586396 RepID=A0AAV0M1S0_9ROSI|nr:unnamed protein product [Linum tenue]
MSLQIVFARMPTVVVGLLLLQKSMQSSNRSIGFGELEKDMAGNSRTGKRHKTSHVVEDVASLSDFPDEILHHVLSFVDTKSAVRTGLLSKRWTSLWKDVPVLNFVPKSFLTLASFRKHVYRLLSFRSHRTPVRDVNFDVCGYTRNETGGHIRKTIGQIMKYASSHSGGGLDHLSITGDSKNLCFSYFADDISTGSHHASLKSMKLEECILWCVQFDDPVYKSSTTLGFKLLTTLELRKCNLSSFCPMGPFDLIGDLPYLKHLKLLHCYVEWLIISGPQLLDLEIEFLENNCSYEVIAPKLKSLRLWGERMGEPIDEHISKELSLPALDDANICLKWHNPHCWESDTYLEEQNRAFMNYLGGLHNVESLNLCFDKEGDEDWEEHHFPLNRIKSIVEHQAPPFTRLKTLRIQCAHQQRPPNVPYQVLRYFLEGSPNAEDKFVKLEMLAD